MKIDFKKNAWFTAMPLCLVMIGLFLTVSCEKKMATYRFTDKDKPKLLPHYIEGKIFTFLNNNGDERKFEVVGIEQKIIQRYSSGGMDGFERYYYYYEKKRILLKDYRNEKKYFLDIFRYPIDDNSARARSHKKFPSHLILEHSSIPYDSEYVARGLYLFSLNYDDPTSTLSSNGFIYNKVHIIDRDNGNWVNTDLGGTFNMAKYIYFDEDYGIIGFDSYDGQQWRLENNSKK